MSQSTTSVGNMHKLGMFHKPNRNTSNVLLTSLSEKNLKRSSNLQKEKLGSFMKEGKSVYMQYNVMDLHPDKHLKTHENKSKHVNSVVQTRAN